MAYTLGNKCAKNLCQRIVLLQLIIENVVTCVFGTQCSSFTLIQLISYVLRCDVQQWVQTTRYCQSVMIISNGWRMLSSAEPRGRTESTERDEQPMGGNSNE